MKDIIETTFSEYFVRILFFMACWFVPGLAFIALYFPETLMTMEWWRLGTFSIAVATPVVFSGVLYFSHEMHEHTDRLSLHFQESAGMAGLIFFVFEGVVYLISRYLIPVPLEAFGIVAGGGCFVFGLIGLIRFNLMKSRLDRIKKAADQKAAQSQPENQTPKPTA